MTDDITIAWHFVGDTLRDGRPIPPDGQWLVHEGPVEMCECGLHASKRLFDALRYAPGNTICRVGVRDIIDRDRDKIVARRRVILWRLDAGDTLRAFARRAALSVIHLWDAPNVVRQYLETGDESLRDAAGAAARAAARDAAWNAARAAARNAARNAAKDAAWYAAWNAARAAARNAARNAAWYAARDAAWAKFDADLTALVREAAGNPDDAELLERSQRHDPA